MHSWFVNNCSKAVQSSWVDFSHSVSHWNGYFWVSIYKNCGCYQRNSLPFICCPPVEVPRRLMWSNERGWNANRPLIGQLEQPELPCHLHSDVGFLKLTFFSFLLSVFCRDACSLFSSTGYFLAINNHNCTQMAKMLSIDHSFECL